MTAALAAFVTSPKGQYYDLVCQRYGVDPGAAFDDDWLAFELRAGLIAAASRPTEEPDDAGKQFEREWLSA